MQVALQSVAGGSVESGLSVLHHLLQVGLVDAGHLVAVGIILTVGLIEIDLGQEGGSGSLGGASLVCLRHG